MIDRIPLIQDGETYVLAGPDENVRMNLIQLIGEGATYLAYKAVEEVNGIPKRVCVIKEYHPAEKGMFEYKREKAGEPLQLAPNTRGIKVFSEEQAKSLYQEEILNQEENAKQEVQKATDLFYNQAKQENSPFLYQTEYFTRLGDTYYLKVDTSEGRTLYDYLKENGKGYLSLKEGLEMTRKLLDVTTQVLGDRYIHGDIKPQNIWICGQGSAVTPILLDLGSAFKRDEYCCEGFESWSEEEVISKADYIVKNKGIGCSTKGYCNDKVNAFYDAKVAYYNAKDLVDWRATPENVRFKHKAAVQLLEAMNQLDVSSDLFSIVETMSYCVTQKNQTMEAEDDAAAYKFFSQMLKKNREEGYTSAMQLHSDLNKLERILNKDAEPEVLLEAIQKSLSDIRDIDPNLFGKIK